MANRLDHLNERFWKSETRPRISGMSLHFTEGGRVQVSITVSMGRSGFGFGNVILGPDDKRLAPIYELIGDVIDDESAPR